MVCPLNTCRGEVEIAVGSVNEYVQPQSTETEFVAVELDDLVEAEARELCSRYGITLEELLEQFFGWMGQHPDEAAAYLLEDIALSE